MKDKIHQLTTQLKNTYESICKQKGKKINCVYGKPATEKEILKFEKSAGFKLPPSFREFLLIHNGAENFAGMFDIMTLKEQIELLKTIHQSDPYDPILMIGVENDENNLCLDFTTVDLAGEMKFLIESDDNSEPEELENFEAYLSRQLLSLNSLQAK